MRRFSSRALRARSTIYLPSFYTVPENIRKGYFKVKILELLLFLSSLPADPPKKSGYTCSQIALAQQVCAYLSENCERKLTMQELSAHFGASPLAHQQMLLRVYGMTPPRVPACAENVRRGAASSRTDRTVLDIAGQFRIRQRQQVC